jgi:transcription termination factor Rho
MNRIAPSSLVGGAPRAPLTQVSPLPAASRHRPPAAPETAAVDGLRRVLAGLDAQQALELLLDKIRDTSSNAEFLRQVLAHPRVA